eukprot:TRINITY_DN1194_c0_g1_i2.p1 TRINITY_DN1194_c0_g1~~TRINITY_DN1194_c0_g1_i2.p1  ORF type:complete len:241 (-),score=61.34 TRINITY_DN1194_c0_g1_i2:22-744(-)
MLKGVENMSPDQQDEFEREVALLAKLHNPHVVEFVGVVVSATKLWLVTEFIAGGTLKKTLYNLKPLPFGVKVKIALDIAQGMKTLHDNNIIHRDLKSDNLLVCSLSLEATSTVKLTDFGTSRTIGDNKAKTYTKGVGTPIYMSPELLKGEQYNSLTDVYSYGVLCYEVLTQAEPYASFTNTWAIASFVVGGERPALPANTEPQFAAMVNSCWAQVPSARPTFTQVVSFLSLYFQTQKHAQ